MPLFKKKKPVTLGGILRETAKQEWKVAKHKYKRGETLYSDYLIAKKRWKEAKYTAKKLKVWERPGAISRAVEAIVGKPYQVKMSGEKIKELVEKRYGVAFPTYPREILVRYFPGFTRLGGVEIEAWRNLAEAERARGPFEFKPRSLVRSNVVAAILESMSGAGPTLDVSTHEMGGEEMPIRGKKPREKFNRLKPRLEKLWGEKLEIKRIAEEERKRAEEEKRRPEEERKKARDKEVLNLKRKLERYVKDTKYYSKLEKIIGTDHTKWEPEDVKAIKSVLRRMQEEHHLEGVLKDFTDATKEILKAPHKLRDPKYKKKYMDLLNTVRKVLDKDRVIAKAYGIAPDANYQKNVDKKRKDLEEKIKILEKQLKYPMTFQPLGKKSVEELLNDLERLEAAEKNVDVAWRAHQLLTTKSPKELEEEEAKIIKNIIKESLKGKKRIEEDVLSEASRLILKSEGRWNEDDIDFARNLISKIEKEEQTLASFRSALRPAPERKYVPSEEAEEFVDLTNPDEVMNFAKDYIESALKKRLTGKMAERALEAAVRTPGETSGEAIARRLSDEALKSWLEQYSRHITETTHQIVKELTGKVWDLDKGEWVHKRAGVSAFVPKVKAENLRKMIEDGLKVMEDKESGVVTGVSFELPPGKRIRLIDTYFKDEHEQFRKKKKSPQ